MSENEVCSHGLIDIDYIWSYKNLFFLLQWMCSAHNTQVHNQGKEDSNFPFPWMQETIEG